MSTWISVVEDDYILNDSDDTDTDFCTENNVESKCDESANPTALNIYLFTCPTFHTVIENSENSNVEL